MARRARNHVSKIPHRRVRRRTVRRDWARIARVTLFVCVVVAYGVACGWVLLLWEGTRVTHITVTGTHRMDAAVLTARVRATVDGVVWHWFPRAQYVLVRPEKIAAAVRALSGVVRDVRVVKRFPDAVEVAVTEWDMVYVWCTVRDGAETCALLTDDGHIGRRVPPDAPVLRDNPVVRIYDTSGRESAPGAPVPTITPALLRDIAAQFERIGVPLVSDRFEVPHRRAREVIATTREGWQINLATDRPLGEATRAVASVLAHALTPEQRAQLAMLDVRFGRKVFYRLRSQETVDAPADMARPLDE